MTQVVGLNLSRSEDALMSEIRGAMKKEWQLKESLNHTDGHR